MGMEKAAIIDGEEPLSKALDAISRTGTVAIVTKEGKYFGVIGDRTIRRNLSDVSRAKCIIAAVRAPGVPHDANTLQMMSAFLTGSYKALPVVKRGKIMGVMSRSDVMRRMVGERLAPKVSVEMVMKTPIYTVDMNETLGVAKRIMREKGVHKLAVTRRGSVIGTVSTFDFSMVMLKPKGRDRLGLISEVKKPDEKVISEFLRERLVTVKRTDSLQQALEKMAEKNISTLVVKEGEKAIGVVTALDVMKFVMSIASAEPEIFISGLPEEDIFHFDKVKGTLGEVLSTYGKVFHFDHVNVHFKKGKTAYMMNVHMGVDHEPLSIKGEGYDLKTTVNAVSAEIKRLLNKKKMHRKRGRRPFLEVET
jgi:CBS domain-containing protein